MMAVDVILMVENMVLCVPSLNLHAHYIRNYILKFILFNKILDAQLSILEKLNLPDNCHWNFPWEKQTLH